MSVEAAVGLDGPMGHSHVRPPNKEEPETGACCNPAMTSSPRTTTTTRALIRQDKTTGPTTRAITKTELQESPASPGRPGQVRSSRVPFPFIFSSSAGPTEPWEAILQLTDHLQ